MAAEALELLLRLNLALAGAVVLVLALRAPMRAWFGARIAYGLWWIGPAAIAAVMLPARTVEMPVLTAAPRPPSLAPTFASNETDTAAMAASVDSSALLLGVWLIGVVAMLLVLAVRQRVFVASLGRLSREPGGTMRAEATGVGPAIIGALRPRLVLPRDFETRFDDAERDLVLAHERVHLKSGDARINGLVALAQCLCWFNPFAHLAAHVMRIDQELACDAAVAAKYPNVRRAYAEAMLKTQVAPMSLPIGCYWPARGAHPLKLRIVMLKRNLPGEMRAAWGAVAAGALVLGAGVAAWAAQPPVVILKTARAPASQPTPPIGADIELMRVEPQGKPSRAEPARSPAAAKTAGAPAARPAASTAADAELLSATRQGNLPRAEKAIAAGADVNARTQDGLTALVIAARKEDMRILNLLLGHGADVHLTSPGEGNALVAGGRRGHVHAVAALVEHGADVNAIAPGYGTPLAASVRTGQLSVVKYLVEHGADVNAASPLRAPWDRWGVTRTPLEVAVQGDHALIAAYLRSKGAAM